MSNNLLSSLRPVLFSIYVPGFRESIYPNTTLTWLRRNIINSISANLPSMLDDPATNVIVIRGSGGKAFCAGGDVKALHGAGQQVRIAFAAASQRATYKP